MRVDRRRFLQVGGALTLGAVLTACLGDGDSDSAQEDTGGAAGRRTDVTITRTLSSVEEVAVVVYETGLSAGLLTTAAIGDLSTLFQSHHREHATLFRGATEDLRGTPFTEPNPAVMEQLQPRLDGLRDEGDFAQLAFDIETILAQTYQSTMGAFGDSSFNIAAMSVGGAEARHAAAFAPVLRQSSAPNVFQPTQQAVPSGTGV
jgi:hypothetical protein